jgi:hypothetical protein
LLCSWRLPRELPQALALGVLTGRCCVRVAADLQAAHCHPLTVNLHARCENLHPRDAYLLSKRRRVGRGQAQRAPQGVRRRLQRRGSDTRGVAEGAAQALQGRRRRSRPAAAEPLARRPELQAYIRLQM